MKLASKTLEAINTLLEQDQGTEYRRILKELLPNDSTIYAPARKGGQSVRLGPSLIGHPCERAAWYSFRWASAKDAINGKMIRLFNRGVIEESRVLALFKMIGCEVWINDPKTKKQFSISGYNHHVFGMLDGVIKGIPDMPLIPAVIEIKTHNNKSFTSVISKGVQETKFDHYVQCQLYMAAYKLNWALYAAVNKDNDELHLELIEFSAAVANRYSKRAANIIENKFPPPKIDENPNFYQCRFCDHIRVCHLDKQPLMNCRTCKFSKPVENGNWICINENTKFQYIDKERQQSGCAEHTYWDK